MNKLLASGIIAFTVLSNVYAMELEGEEKVDYPVYVATKSAIGKAMKKMGYDYTVDEDGDFRYQMDSDDGYHAYVIFNTLSDDNDKIWNLQLVAQFGTKVSKYDKLIDYANTYNTDYKRPKISMIDKDSLRLAMNYPVEFGFNPEEFEENYFLAFERTVKSIAEETYDWRK